MTDPTPSKLPSFETNRSRLKIDGWKDYSILYFWDELIEG